MVAEAAPKSLAQKAMFDKGKASGYFPDAVGFKWFFFDGSEERRVGKECRTRWSPDHEEEKESNHKCQADPDMTSEK